ncbi:MAG: hypothetical protein DBY30_04285 [Verrucomicrobia bacterium]|nr:MAG: hypothetical protein DBY30_04285 [Verrucomicrobiota bacterium]
MRIDARLRAFALLGRGLMKRKKRGWRGNFEKAHFYLLSALRRAKGIGVAARAADKETATP